jgi:hypothetical protein
MHLQWPLVVEEKIGSEDAEQARADQHGRPLSAWQEYACRKFGSDCRVALAIQRAENPQGKVVTRGQLSTKSTVSTQMST